MPCEAARKKRNKDKKQKKAKKADGKKASRAGFKRGGHKKSKKAAQKAAAEKTEKNQIVPAPATPTDAPAVENGRHRDYDLEAMKIPKAAWPQAGKNLGAHSYALRSVCGKASIEVLLRAKAFYVKRLAEGADGPIGQITFKIGRTASEAWAIAKQRSGYDQP